MDRGILMGERDKLFVIQKVLGVLQDTEWGPNSSSALAQMIADSKSEDRLTPERQVALGKVMTDLQRLLEDA